MPSPGEVAREMYRSRHLLWRGALTTFKEVLIGFAIACGVAFPIGIAIAFSRILARLIYPLIVASQSVPVVAIAPLFLVWFGFGILPKVLVAALIAFFPIVIATVAGLRVIDEFMLHMARASGAPRFRIFRKIRVPIALPNIFSGLKLAITFSVIGAVVGEFVAGTSGLGYIVQNAEGNQQTGLAFAAIVLLGAVSLCLFYLVEAVEHRMIKQ
jgi:NitT/TauT family transport system permease protein